MITQTNQTVCAAKHHACESCDALIAKGTDCLRTIEGGFRMWRHLGCAATLVNVRGELVYDCLDLRSYIAHRAAKARASADVIAITSHARFAYRSSFPSAAHPSSGSAKEARSAESPFGADGMSSAAVCTAVDALELHWESC